MFEILYSFTIPQDYSYINEFIADVFPTVGIVSLIFPLVLALLFYVLINRFTDKMDQLWHWAIVLIINLIFGAAFAYMTANNYLIDTNADENMTVPVLFYVMNALYCGLYFFIFSILLKKASKFATKIPF